MPNLRSGRRVHPLLWLLFGLKGRISRKVYWLGYLLLLCLNAVLIGQLFGGEQASFYGAAQAVGPFIILATLYSNIAMAVKRLHDSGYSGFLAIALLVPLINLAFTIWVGILPGTAGPNPYGDAADDPPQ